MRDSREHIPDFEEILKDIDDDILNDPTLPNSKAANHEIPINQVANSCNLVDIAIMEGDHIWENQKRELNGKLLDAKAGGVNNKVEFSMGWTKTGFVGVTEKIPIRVIVKVNKN